MHSSNKKYHFHDVKSAENLAKTVLKSLREKCPNKELLLVRIFLYLTRKVKKINKSQTDAMLMEN